MPLLASNASLGGMKHPIEKAAEIAGSEKALADWLGVTKAAVWQWKQEGRKTPIEHCPEIERRTGGAVTCEELLPGATWVRIPDAAWPHPLGRPVLDFCPPTTDSHALTTQEVSNG